MNKDQERKALLQKALSLHQSARFREAEEVYREILARDPSHFDALQLLAMLQGESGNYTGAVSLFDDVIRLRPTYAEGWSNRGAVLQSLKRWIEALASFERAILIKPEYATALYNRGVALAELNQSEESLASYDKAIKIKGDYAEALYNRGNTLETLKRWEEALVSYDKAACSRPTNELVWSNRSLGLQYIKRWDDAIASFDKASRIKPDYADVHFNCSHVLLLLGRFTEGWTRYEWRLKTEKLKNSYYGEPQLAWRGQESIAGKRLLIYCEQGLGDSIQFIRYLPKILDFGAEIFLSAPKPLISLFSGMQLPVKLIVTGTPIPEFDAHCPLMSLPYVFKTTLETIPASIPYINYDHRKVANWEQQLGLRKQVRVGLVWSGSITYKGDSNRSIPLETLLPLLELPIEWHSLQKEYREIDRVILDKEPRIQRHENELCDFSDTGALINCLDLVISVDTSIAHLAGAMGKPVWILLPFAPDFRWLLDRDDSPWYPSAKLFRQDERRNWNVVIDTVKNALREKTLVSDH